LLKSKLLFLFFIFCIANSFGREINKQNMTNWKIEPSFKYDALCFLNIMTADTFYLTYYQEEYDRFKKYLSPNYENSFKNLKTILKDENGRIVSAYLCLYFSAVEDSTLHQLMLRLDNLDELKKNFEKTPYHDEESWKLFESIVPDLKEVLWYLQDIYFEAYWKKIFYRLLKKPFPKLNPTCRNMMS
jgi:hypothetical protein